MPEIQVSRTNRRRSRAHAGRRAGLVLALVLGTGVSVLGLLATLETPADDVVLRVPTSPGGLPAVPDLPGDDREPAVRPSDDRPSEPEPPTSSNPPEVRTADSDLDSGDPVGQPVDQPVDPPPGPAVDAPLPQGPADVPVPDPEPSDEPDPVRDLVDEITGAAPATEPVGDALIDVLDLLDLPVRHPS